MLQSFMEESNIRWGEIIAAVLIVLSSVGLVMSLRNTLQEHSVFPGDPVHAVHGRVSRRGPVHAAAVEAARRQPRDPDHLAVAGAADVRRGDRHVGQRRRRCGRRPIRCSCSCWRPALGIFAWVSYSASRELVGRGAWPLAVGVLGCSASQVLIHRTDLAAARLLAADAPSRRCRWAATWWRRWRSSSGPRMAAAVARAGAPDPAACWASRRLRLAAPLALLLVRSEPQWHDGRPAQPALSLAAAAVLALGLLIHRRTTARTSPPIKRRGTAI